MSRFRNPMSLGLLTGRCLSAVLVVMLTTASWVAKAGDATVAVADSPDPVLAGTDVTYDFTVSNVGAGAVTAVQVSLDLDDNMTLSSSGGTGWTCLGSDPVVCTLAGSLAGDTSDTALSIVATAPTDPSLTLTSDTTLTATGDSNGTNGNSASNSTEIDANADLDLTMTDDADPVLEGQSIDYTLSVTNNGPNQANNVSVSIDLDDVIGSASASGTGWTCGMPDGNNVIVCTLDAAILAASATTSDINVTGTAPLLAGTAPEMVTSTASVTSVTGDSVPANNASGNIVTTINPAADLSTTVVDDVDPVDAGQNVVYTVTVNNGGPNIANSVSLDINYPAGATVVSATGTGWTCNTAANPVVCTRTSLAASTSAEVNMTLTAPNDPPMPPPSNQITVSATASASTGDPNAANDTGAQNTTVTPVSDLSITKDDGVTAAIPGESQLNYSIVVSNAGPSLVTNATVADTFPSELSGCSWTCSADTGSSCAAAMGTGNIATTVTLESGDSATFVATCDVDADALGTLTNTATVGVPTGWSDGNTANNTASDTNTEMTPEVVLTVTKDNGQTGVSPAELFAYTINVSNAGPSDAGDVTLLDDVDLTRLERHTGQCPASMDPDPPPCWECSMAMGGATCPTPTSGVDDLEELFSLPAGGSVVFTIYARVRDDATGQIVNTAFVDIENEDVTERAGSVNTDTDTDDIDVATDLNVVKTDNLLNATPGEAHSYTVTVRNDGAVSVQDASLTDPFPIWDGTTTLAGYASGATINWSCSATNDQACCTGGTSTECGRVDPVTGSVPANGMFNRLINLDPTGELVFTFTSTLDSRSTGTLSNTATITVPAGVNDFDNSNDMSEDTTTMAAAADLSLSKVVSTVTDRDVDTDMDMIPDATVFDVVYLVDIINRGPSRAEMATVIDNFDPVYTDVSWTCSVEVDPLMGSACSNAMGMGNLNEPIDLDVGGRIRFTITATTMPDALGEIFNTATVNYPLETTPENNSDTARVALTATADLSIVKTDGLTTATPGTEHTYSVRVDNAGPDDIFGASVLDTMPANLTGVTWQCSAVSPIPGDISFQDVFGLLALDGISGIGISPDGEHVYASSALGNSVVAFNRETALGFNFGEISLLEVETDGADDPTDSGLEVMGLAGASALVVSPDGRHVYATAFATVDMVAQSSVVVFSRDSLPASGDFGRLNFVEAEFNDMDDVGDPGPMVTGMDEPIQAAMSFDGRHLYVVSEAGNALAIFERDLGTGRLSFVASETTSLVDPVDVVLSPSGGQVYVADASGLVVVYTRDTDDLSATFGQLTQLDIETDGTMGVSGMSMPAAITTSPTGAHIYVGDADGSVVTFDRTSGTGELTYKSDFTDPMESWTDLAVSPDGEHLFGVGDTLSSMVVMRRNLATGLLSSQQELVDGFEDQPGGVTVDGLVNAAGLAVSPDGQHVLTAGSGDSADVVAVFERRAPDPNFQFVEYEQFNRNDPGDGAGVVQGLFGARGLAVGPGGAQVYVTGFGTTDTGPGRNSLVVFDRDSTKGGTPDTRGEHLVFNQTVFYDDAGISGLDGPAGVIAAGSTNGGHVYVASERDNAVVVFDRDAVSGQVTFKEVFFDGTGGVDGLLGATNMAFDPNEAFLYVAGKFDGAIAIFSRALDADPAVDGQLTFVGTIANGIGGTVGLSGVSDLAITPDGQHLVAASEIDDALVVFRRDLTTGTLSYVQTLFNGVGGVGLDRAIGVVISPDGEQVYAVGANSDTLSVYQRNSDPLSDNYGRLTFIEEHTQGAFGITSLDGARAVEMSRDPSGRFVYVGAEFDAALTVFERNTDSDSPDFGTLQVVEVRRDNVGNVEGLSQLYNIAVSEDNRHVYTSGLGDHAVAAFLRRAGSRCSASGTGNINDIVDVGNGGTLTYTITGTIRADASGSIENTACILPPSTATDPDLIGTPAECSVAAVGSNNNISTDTTSLIPAADLRVTKSDGLLNAISGDPVTYTITLENDGPSNAVSADTPIMTRVRLRDLFDTNDFNLGTDGMGMPLTTWTCEGVGSGVLRFVDVHDSSEAGLEGLAGAASVAVGADPDDPDLATPLRSLVFAVGVTGSSLSVFQREEGGDITPLLSVADGDMLDDPSGTPTTVSGLLGARDVTVSSDGTLVFVAGQANDLIAVFEVRSNAGVLDLRFVGSFSDPAMDQPVAVALSADDANLYVAAANSDAIVAFDVAASGMLSPRGSDTGAYLDGASDVVVSLDGQNVYVVSTNNGGLSLYDRAGDGSLTYVETLDENNHSQLTGASGLAIDPDGEQVYVASLDANSVVAFSRSTADGTLSFLQALTDGDAGVTGLRSVRGLAISADGFHLYAAAQRDDALVLLRRDDVSGTLTIGGFERDNMGATDGLNGVAAVAVSADGAHVYAAGSVDNAVSAFQRPADTFCSVDSGTNNVDDAGLDGIEVNVAAGGQITVTVDTVLNSDAQGMVCTIDPERNCVFNTATVTTVPDTLDDFPSNDSFTDENFLSRRADLRITKTDGLAEYDGLEGASDVVISSDGEHVYSAGADDNAIGIFRRISNSGSPDYGRVTFQGFIREGEDGVTGIADAQGLALSADGQHLYVAGAAGNAISVFVRETDAMSEDFGNLQFLALYQNGAGVSGLSGASDVALSGDGKHVYASGRNSNAIAVFARDDDMASADFGKLSFVESLQQGVGGVTGLIQPEGIAFDVNSEHLYVASRGSTSVAVFEREDDSGAAGFGQLTFVESLANGDQGGAVAGLTGVSDILVSHDGGSVYAAGSGAGAVVVFERDPATGQLTYLIDVQDGDQSGAVMGLSGAASLVLSELDEHLYVAGANAASVVQFDRDGVSGLLTFHSVISNGDPGTMPGVPVSGLAGVSALALSPGDNHLYGVSAIDSAIAGFERETMPTPVVDFGTLGFLQSWFDGGGGASPGDTVDYTITVTNLGPSDVVDARVVDNFPPQFESVSWTCSFADGAVCTDGTSGTGSIDVQVEIPVGGSIVFDAGGQIITGASGRLSNTATVTPPVGVIDPNLINNSATDDDTVLNGAANISVLKENLTMPLVAGQPVTYQVTVSNAGPSEAPSVLVRDIVPEAIADVTWMCEADPLPGQLEAVACTQCVNGADGFVDLAVSPDGLFAYAVGPRGSGDAIVVFNRDSRTGELVFDSFLSDPPQPAADPIDGLLGAAAVVVSSDGQHVYVASSDDDAVAIFERNGLTGKLTFLAVERDGVNGVDGLGGASDLLLDPTGNYLYASAAIDNAVAVFQRDPVTGLLTFIERRQNGFGGVTGMGGASSLAISSDGANLYVAGPSDDSIAIFDIAGNGTLSFLAAVTEGDMQTSGMSMVSVDGLLGVLGVAVSADGSYLAATGNAEDAVALFRRDAMTGELLWVSKVDSTDAMLSDLQGPAGIAFSADGVEIYVSALASDTLIALRRDDDSMRYLDDEPVTTAVPGHNVTIAEDRHVYAALGTELQVFERQPGSLCTFSGTGNVIDTARLSVMGEVVYTITGRVVDGATGDVENIATATSDDGTVDSDVSDNNNGVVDPIELQSDLRVTKVMETSPVVAGLPVSWRVTVENLGPGDVFGAQFADQLPVFPTDPGGLIGSSIAWQCTSADAVGFLGNWDVEPVSGVRGANWTAISPDGSLVIATNTDADAMVVFSRQADDSMPDYGQLTYLQSIFDGDTLGLDTVDGLAGIGGVAFSPDGMHIYVAGGDDQAVAAFGFDEMTGDLIFLGASFEGDNNLQGLGGAAGIRVTPDGRHVLVAGKDDDALVVLERDPDTGLLDFVERQKDGIAGLPLQSLTDVNDLAISPDGTQVISASQDGDALALFQRDALSGMLTFSGVIRDGDVHNGSGGPVFVEGLLFPRSVAFSPNGEFVYVASLTSDAVSVFERDTSTGELIFIQVLQDGVGGVQGLDGASAVAMSPDGAFVYVASINSDAISVFARAWNTGLLTYLGSVVDGQVQDAPNTPAIAGGLSGASGLAVAGDGVHVYIASRFSEQVAAFARQPNSACGIGTGTDALVQTSLDLASGSQVDFLITAVLHPSARGTLDNSASILPNCANVPPVMDPDLADCLTPAGNNLSSTSDVIEVSSDLSIVKDDGQETLIAGLPNTYTITVDNAGPSDALGAEVNDAFPPEFTMVDWTCSATGASTCTAMGSGDITDIVNLLAGDTLTYVATGVIDPGFVGDTTNVATIVTDPLDGDDPDLTNNGSTDIDAVVPVTDVAVSKDNGQDGIIPGTMVTYVIDVVNNGPSHLVDGEITDIAPARLLNVQWTCTPTGGATCTAAGSGDILDTVSIPVGDTLQYVITAQLDPFALGGQIINTASSMVFEPTSDPIDTNDDGTDVDPVLDPVGELSVVKTDSADPVIPGDPLTWTIEVTNAGPSVARDVVATDTPPADIINLTTLGCAEDPSGLPDCSLGDMLPGETRMYTITGIVASSARGLITNTVSVQSSAIDTDLSDNTASQDTTIFVEADGSVSKSDGIDETVPGAFLTYIIEVNNAGPSDILDARVVDMIPPELINATWTCAATGGTSCPASGSGDIDLLVSMQPGAMLTFTVDAQIDPNLNPNMNPVVQNTVTLILESGEFDPTPGDLTATDITLVTDTLFKDSFEQPGMPVPFPGDGVLSVLNAEWSEDRSPLDSACYSMAFDLDMAGVNMALGNRHDLAVGYDAHGRALFAVELSQEDAGRTLALRMLDDAGVWHLAPASLVSAASQRVELTWRSADGLGSAALDGAAMSARQLSNIDNPGMRLDVVRFGNVWGVDPGSSGTLRMSNFNGGACDG